MTAVLVVWDLLLRLWSWAWGHWKGIALLVIVSAIAGGLWWMRDSAYEAGRAAEQAVTTARAAKAAGAARAAAAAAKAQIDAAEKARSEDRAEIDARDAAFRLLAGSMWELTNRPRAAPRPSTDAACAAELARERNWADACGVLLARGVEAVGTQARERDAAVADLWAVRSSWPRKR